MENSQMENSGNKLGPSCAKLCSSLEPTKFCYAVLVAILAYTVVNYSSHFWPGYSIPT